MDPEKPSPWVTSVPGKRQAREREPGEHGPVRYWIPQPWWFRGPALAAIPLLGVGAFLYTGWPPHNAGSSVLLVATAAIAIVLFFGAHSGRVTMQERGILVQRFGGDQFVPYSQLGSVRVLVIGEGRNRETFVLISLVVGDPIRLGGLDVEGMCRSILAAKAAWERSRDDSEPPAAESIGDERGSYRSRPRS